MKKRIEMTLTGNHRARFEYTDGVQALTHYEELRARMATGGLAIKTITIADVVEEPSDERNSGDTKTNHRKNTVLGDRSQ